VARDSYVYTGGGPRTPLRQLRLRTVFWRALPHPPWRGTSFRQLLWTDAGLTLADDRHGGRVAVLEGRHWRRLPGPGFRSAVLQWWWTGRRLVAPFAAHGSAAAVDPRTGRWSRVRTGPFPGEATTGLATSDGPLVLEGGRLYDDRTERSVQLPLPPGVEAGSTVVDGRSIYLLDEDSHWWVLPVRAALG
jgi:hypothetical protein